MKKNKIYISRDLDLLGEPQGSADRLPDAATTALARKAGKRARSEAASPEGWDTFRARYPRRPGARWPRALKKYEQLLRGGTKPEVILAGCEGYARQVARDGTAPRYVRDPSNWLDEDGFNDEDFVQPAIATAAPANAASINWPGALRLFAQSGGIKGGGSWPAALGPPPGQKGCMVPPQLLEQFSRENA